MPDNTFMCSECGQEVASSGALPGAFVQCPSCHSLVNVPKPSSAHHAAEMAAKVEEENRRKMPGWVYFAGLFVLCAIGVGLLSSYIQRNARVQEMFQSDMLAAENAERPEDGVRLIDSMLLGNLEDGQKAQARALRSLLCKRIQVEKTQAAAHEEEAAKRAASAVAAAKVKPILPPPPSMADAETEYAKGVRLACGIGVPKDEAAAIICLRQAAIIGLPAAQYDLAAMLADGIGCATNLGLAADWGRKLAEQDHLEVQAWLGYILACEKAGFPFDPVQAAQWNEKAAAQGHVTAIYNLGIQYAMGQGVRQESTRAFRLFADAAARGNADAQMNLGMMYWKGLGVPQNPTNAFLCFQKAHEQGNTQATFALGLLYGTGSGVVKDRPMAATYLLAAARKGHVGAQKQMARMYFTASGVPESEQDSIYWMRQAAAQGDRYAIQAVEAYQNSRLPPVFAPCTACAARGSAVRICPACRGAGTLSSTVTSKSIRACSCGWQMVNGRCPNCGRVENNARTVTTPCVSCNGTGRQNTTCTRCGGVGQVRVAGPAQDTYAQMLSRPDTGHALDISFAYLPMRLSPFRAGMKRDGGI